MSPRRELVVVLAAAALGALLVVVASSRRWIPVRGSTLEGGALGREAAPAAFALAMVALVGLVALLATRRVGRLVVSVLVALAGAGIAWESMWSDFVWTGFGVERAGETAWPVVSAAGGVLVLVGGVLAIVRGHRWPGMGSRYDAPASTPGRGDPWTALDRGEDPTE